MAEDPNANDVSPVMAWGFAVRRNKEMQQALAQAGKAQQDGGKKPAFPNAGATVLRPWTQPKTSKSSISS